jgi:hypothetical protein
MNKADNASGRTGTRWRDQLQIHRACELLPPLPRGELIALGEDIKVNRLQERAKVMREADKFVLLDGSSRLDAIEAVGLPIKVFVDGSLNKSFFEIVEARDPVAFVISANIYRRHLSGQDKERLIADLIKLGPAKSNRQIAKQTDSSPTTVGKVRDKLEVSGDVSTVDTRTDARGRQQPAHKPPPLRRPEPPTLPVSGEASPPLKAPAQSERSRLTPVVPPDPIVTDQHTSVVRAAIQGVINVRDIMKTDFGVVAFFLSPKEREAERNRASEAIEILKDWDEALAEATTAAAPSTPLTA